MHYLGPFTTVAKQGQLILVHAEYYFCHLAKPLALGLPSYLLLFSWFPTNLQQTTVPVRSLLWPWQTFPNKLCVLWKQLLFRINTIIQGNTSTYFPRKYLNYCSKYLNYCCKCLNFYFKQLFAAIPVVSTLIFFFPSWLLSNRARAFKL